MMIDVTVSLPKHIYDIYANAAQTLNGHSVESVLSAALQAYAQYLFNEMMASGELQEKPYHKCLWLIEPASKKHTANRKIGCMLL